MNIQKKTITTIANIHSSYSFFPFFFVHSVLNVMYTRCHHR